MKQPNFIRQFSKQESPEERTKLAREIKEKRANYFKEKGNSNTKENEKAKIIQQIEVLQQRVEKYNDQSFFGKMKNFFSVRKVQAELGEYTEKKMSIEDALVARIEGRSDLDETRTMLSDFYKKENKKWSEAPYSKEDLTKYFSEENLASLSVDNYALLMRRFPEQMVTHVTRQGVRDHYGMYEHSQGVGEVHNGFKDMIQSKRLRSPLGASMAQSLTYHDICEFLNGGREIKTPRDLLKAEDEPMDINQLVKQLKYLTDSKKNFHDKAAIHFAVEKVLDGIYGGEIGNEIFIAYPSAHIASQYNFFNGNKNDLVTPPDSHNDKHNDLYVWEKNEADGMSIDAGVVFIPGNANVDVQTGSKYALDNSGQPIAEGDGYKTADHTVSSQEYWEDYFSQHPESRPSKVVYYDSSLSPTGAMWDWKIKNGVIDESRSKKASSTLGFDENAISSDFNRPGGKDALVNFHQLALTALAHEYGSADVIHSYDKDFFARPEEEWQEKIDTIYKAK